MTRWKSQFKRIRPSGGPNHLRIAYQSLQILVRSHLHMIKLAPLLFDNLAIERQIAKRLLAINRELQSLPPFRQKPGSRNRNILGQMPDLLAATRKKVRAKIMEEAWQNLSPETMEALKLEWQVLNLASHVAEKASANLTSYLRFADLSISEFLTLTYSFCEIAKAHRWNVPPDISRLDAGLAEFSMEKMVQNGTNSPENGTTDPGPRKLHNSQSEQAPATKSKRDQNTTRYSNNIIRLTTFLSAMHEEEEQLNGSAAQPQRAAVS